MANRALGLIDREKTDIAIGIASVTGDRGKGTLDKDSGLYRQFLRMDAQGMMSEHPGAYVNTNGDTTGPASTARLPLTWRAVRTQIRLREACQAKGLSPWIIGEHFHSRHAAQVDELLKKPGPKIVGPGNFYEALVILKALEGADRRFGRKGKAKPKPLVVYNPRGEDGRGFWDDLFAYVGLDTEKLKQARIHICETEAEVADQYGKITRAGKIRKAFNEAAPPVDVRADRVVYFCSNNRKKGFDFAQLFRECGIATDFRYLSDLVGAMPNAPEESGTGEGNAMSKAKAAAVLVKSLERHGGLTDERGYKAGSATLSSDIVMEFHEPGLIDHPRMQKYRHLVLPGQEKRIPGSEMAYMAQVAGMDSFFDDVNAAFDDMEQSRADPEGRVDRRLTIRSSLILSEVKGSGRSCAVTGVQTYQLLRQPQPSDCDCFELENHIAFQDRPDVSVAEIQERDGRMHLETHNARAVRALIKVAQLPLRPGGEPRPWIKPRLVLLLTDRNLMGNLDPTDLCEVQGNEFNLAQNGYRISRDPIELSSMADFRELKRKFRGLIVFPPRQDMTLLDKVRRLTLVSSWVVGQSLGDHAIKGGPVVLADPALHKLFASLHRKGKSALLPEHSYRDPLRSGGLVNGLDASWKPHEFIRYPRDAQRWDFDIPQSPRTFNVAFLGSAKSQDLDGLTDSRRLVRGFIAKGWGIRHGHGGEGDMNEFAQAGIDAARNGENVWQFGVTTPLAAIEKNPPGYEDAGFEWTMVPDMEDRVPGILMPDVQVCVARRGGPGTVQEIAAAMLDNLTGKASRKIIICNDPEYHCGRKLGPWDGLLEMFSAKELSDMNVEVVRTVGQALHVAEAFRKGLERREALVSECSAAVAGWRFEVG
ncbi:MAG: hypothetical protein EOM26_06355 [Alphaproteobacteria bacterium]|nr:hypothetical protein [Alphaproteobacteria bacterium]